MIKDIENAAIRRAIKMKKEAGPHVNGQKESFIQKIHGKDFIFEVKSFWGNPKRTSVKWTASGIDEDYSGKKYI